MASFKQLLGGPGTKRSAEEISEAATILQGRVGNFSCMAPHQADSFDVVFLTEFNLKIRAIWRGWSTGRKASYMSQYGNVLQLTELPVSENMIKAALHFWDPRRRCFNFNGIDLVPTVEEYRRLLGLPKDARAMVFQPKPQKSCKRGLASFLGYGGLYKEARNIIVQPDGKEIIPWECIEEALQGAIEDRVHSHLTLAVYGLVIFPTTPGAIDGAVFELVDQVIKGADPTPAILAETIRSLSFLRTHGTGRFMGCLPLLCTWLKGHLPCKVDKFKPTFSFPPTPLIDILKSSWELPKSFTEWRGLFRTLREDDLVWKAPWMPKDDLIYSCDPYDWVPLLGPWGGTAYAPLQVGRQLENNQIVPILCGMERCDITYGTGKAESIMTRMFQAWTKARVMQYTEDIPEVTLSYIDWRKNLELETYRCENQALKTLASAQRKAIERLRERLQKRERQSGAVVEEYLKDKRMKKAAGPEDP